MTKESNQYITDLYIKNHRALNEAVYDSSIESFSRVEINGRYITEKEWKEISDFILNGSPEISIVIKDE